MDAGQTVNSGQVFLWERGPGGWLGVDGQDLVLLRGGGRAESLRGGHGRLLRRGDRAAAMLAEISRDPAVAAAVRASPGLRLLRQDPFQCCVSFIASSNSGIPNIRRSLRALCAAFGRAAELRGRRARLFPAPARLARASPGEVAACGLGYRAPYVSAAARAVASGEVDLAALARAGYAEARGELLRMPGVGHKVADCIMLFSLDKLEAFPLDRWALRALRSSYPGSFAHAGAALTPRRYEALRAEAEARFGRYAGYAQQFLFKAARDAAGRGW